MHLRAATGSRLESPLYAEGLVALYEGKNDEAIAKARSAFEKAPWMYEPKKLEADALFAEGSKYRHDAAFDYEKMKTYFDPAAEAYKIAAEMGSSDPEVHRATCELWTQTMYATVNNAMPPKNPFATADAACNRAVEASSKDGRARVQRAFLHVMLAYSGAAGAVAAEDALAEAPGRGVHRSRAAGLVPMARSRSERTAEQGKGCALSSGVTASVLAPTCGALAGRARGVVCPIGRSLWRGCRRRCRYGFGRRLPFPAGPGAGPPGGRVPDGWPGSPRRSRGP